ncbi:autotransporter assembly complex protein TamA [Brevundimonas abyssalis]|uniref:autotransporter assembly complex protein TamA n=1 Tax=Brevundimonas abyssalis TaxID=1125965 RepID=UPI001F57EA85|nr:BamA/TamA family outer membrane protein [Brevundimonas abyssalis]
MRFLARAARIDSRIGAELSLPHWRRPGQTLSLASAAVYEDTDAYERTAINLSADLRQRFDRTSWYSYGVGLEGGLYNETRFDPITRGPVDVERDLVILTGRGGFNLDRSNDPLDPRRGWRLSGSAQPTAVTGDDDVYFLRADVTGTGYLPLQDEGRTVLAGRLRVGSIVGAEEFVVPSDRLFYSGGGGSVRGYAYQGVGPRLTDNTPRGGLSLFEASVEVRRDIGENFGAVVFVDGGAVGFEETPNLSNMRYGAGFGVRYRLPFGPIRADVAFPLDKREGDADFQLYISIGQAF